ncbi:MAG: heme ABC exporter ATP-binding protein CcmA [Boseongicola sp.]|nr:heme ABC exporter ATP-binding protein CcmA [Boseongicola sp.]
MDDALLTVSELACARGGLTVLEGVSFEVYPGAVLVLRGPNGSGKTTLLRTLAGLQPAVSGSVVGAEEAVAYAGHADGLKGTLSVAENLSFWAALFGVHGIAPALQAFDLEDLADRPAQALSAGQKRRLGLARMLVTGRPIWLLDEPTVSLDANSVGLFGAAVRRHLGGGGAAVIATHIDLGIDADVMDLGSFRATAPQGGVFDEAFE